MQNPDEIPELVTLDHILKDTGFTVTVYEAPKAKDKYGCEYDYSIFSEKGQLGKQFQNAAEPLVAASGGEIQAWGRSGGFMALFPDEEKRLDFLKAFSNAASALCTPPAPEGILKTADGFVLGQKPRGRF